MAVVDAAIAADLSTGVGVSVRNLNGGTADLGHNVAQQQNGHDPASFQMTVRLQQLQPEAVPSPPSMAVHGSAKRPDGGIGMNGAVAREFEREMKDLRDLLSKLNPMAEEFVPSSLASNGGSGDWSNNSEIHNGLSNGNGFANGGSDGRRKKNGYIQEKRRMNSRTSMAQQAEKIRRTVYVSDIDQQVTEEELAALFLNCGLVIDCRVCGDPNSVLRFAFIEFSNEEGARAALNLSGIVLGYYPVRVLPSKTAIAPVDKKFLPKTPDEREMCMRTIYCTNIDKKATQAELKLFFEGICGEVHRLRLLGDYQHSTRIAFVEFAMAESAIAALYCSGVVLGSMPIRISPSKTPVFPRGPRLPMH